MADESWRDMLHADLAAGRERKTAARGERSNAFYHTAWWRQQANDVWSAMVIAALCRIAPHGPRFPTTSFCGEMEGATT
jgi:hypothetical protein